jgi:hypothetical protein
MSLPAFSTQAELFSTAGLSGSLFASDDRYRLFALKIYPVLAGIRAKLEACYCADNGRIAIEPVLLLGLSLLQYLEAVPDHQAVDLLHYHAGWNFALNRQVGDELFHPTTLVNFRQRLLDHDLSTIGFEMVLEALVQAGLVARQSRQRLDSTQMFGRVSRMSRLDCVRESLRLALGLDKPPVLYVDAAYVSSRKLAEAAAAGRELIGPALASPHNNEGRFTPEQFTVTVEQRQAVCPAGQENTQCSRLQEQATGAVSHRFEWSSSLCGHCPLRQHCIKADHPHRTLVVGEHHTILLNNRGIAAGLILHYPTRTLSPRRKHRPFSTAKALLKNPRHFVGIKAMVRPLGRSYGGHVWCQFSLSAGADVEKSDGASLALPPSLKATAGQAAAARGGRVFI